MGKAVLIMALLLAVIVVIASVTLSVERKADVIPEKIASNEVHSELINLGSYALKWAIRQVLNEQIIETNTSIFDNESGSYHFAFFEVPALDGSIDMITYEFGDTQSVEGGGGDEEDEEEEQEEGTTIPSLDMIFANGDITLTGSARINGTTGTNSTANNSVTFAWSTVVEGDFYVGPGADYNDVIDSQGWGRVPEDNITGTITDLPSARSYPLPDYPDFPELTNRGSFSTAGPPSGEYLIDEDGYYSSISASGNRTITIDVGSGTRRIVVGSLSIGQGHIELQGTGNLILYVENTFSLTGSSVINTSGDASKVHMYYSGATDLDLAGATEYNGSIYIENANLRIGGSGGITGHIICGGSTIDVNGAANAYVRALYAPNADASITGSGSISGILVANTITITGSGTITANTGWIDPIPDIDDSSDDTPAVTGSYVVQVDISAHVSEDEYGNENDHTSFASILVSYSGGEQEEELDVEEEPETPTFSMEADLNINPTNNSSKRFQMQTPSGQIDRNTLNSYGSSYTYSGSASEIRMRVKTGGNSITVNETNISLSTNTTYTFWSDDMTVNLRNTHGGNWNQSKGHWWIEITCSEPTVTPDPGLPEPEEVDDEEIDEDEVDEEEEIGDTTLEDVEIIYWQP